MKTHRFLAESSARRKHSAPSAWLDEWEDTQAGEVPAEPVNRKQRRAKAVKERKAAKGKKP